MPSIDPNFLLLLKEDYRSYRTFIESGTHYGGTIFNIEPAFDKLFTIEYKAEIFQCVKSKYSGTKIEFLQGDSSLVFIDLLPQINEPAVFFLDGHYSCGDTGQSSKDCPLVEELLAIRDLFKPSAIIIIDDQRLFTTGSWSDINRTGLLAILGDRVKNAYDLPSELAENDRLIIHIGEV